jgi:hypothetical protein
MQRNPTAAVRQCRRTQTRIDKADGDCSDPIRQAAAATTRSTVELSLGQEEP